ncbi:MAG TPA: isoprenylcysteine carboxylmethyltransferase family protein [Thermoanaerobaculia bacterium]|nr:isoprenylcysteine carboxylmethyltransferase family protein [Thermoanaerobaculia bacterium]
MNRSEGEPRSRVLASAYFAFQGVAVLAWWALLLCVPSTRSWFLPRGSLERDLLAFAFPDLGLVVVGSLLASVLIARRSRWALPVAFLVAGGMDYAALYCMAWAMASDSAWWNVVLMTPAAFLSTTFAFDGAAAHLPAFRQARPASSNWNVAKTLFQVVAFWSVLLGVLPWAIVWIEKQLGVPGFRLPGQVLLAACLFLAFSALGLYSGMTMAVLGQGTPLPIDSPRRLVVRGPYAYVRNPMAVAGLGQGFSVGLGLGSWGVLLYVLFGGLVWNFIVRPAEEGDLERSFGDEFLRYREQVRCWRPRLKPFRS